MSILSNKVQESLKYNKDCFGIMHMEMTTELGGHESIEIYCKNYSVQDLFNYLVVQVGILKDVQVVYTTHESGKFSKVVVEDLIRN